MACFLLDLQLLSVVEQGINRQAAFDSLLSLF